jgi:hypothetical protein
VQVVPRCTSGLLRHAQLTTLVPRFLHGVAESGSKRVHMHLE